MSSYQESILRRAISKAQFEQLCRLWQQTAQATQALLMTETELLTKGKRCQENFRLLIDQQFCALLFGNYMTEDIVYASMTFDPQTIAQFLPLLKEQSERISLQKRLQQIQQARLAKSGTINRFALQLLEILTLSSELSPSVQQVLCHQERERIFNQVSFQISQNLDWSIILKKTVEQVRSLLQVDRLVIYQTDVDLGEHPTIRSGKAARDEAERRLVDAVTYEALASENVPSILHFHEEICFSESPDCREKYRRGFTLAVDDVSADPDLGLCVQMLLQELQVKAKLVTPINVQGKLWGFLIAHQCFATRQWHQQEIQFLEDIAEYLAIAIDQAQSYQQLQQQKQGLEQQVAQRVQELEEAQIAAQAADQSKHEFLSNISHEFRTPLTHVIGLSSTLMHWSKQGVSFPVHKQQQYLETIHDSGKQLLALINNLLDLSQVKAGQSLLHVSEFSLQQLSRQVFQSVQPVASAQGIILQVDLQIEPHQDRFWADPERVQQILCHLLDNAVKFTPPGNTVTLRVCRENEHAIFQVEDTGIGVAQEQLPLLFNTFQQLEHSRQRTHGGTGLGLTLTKELVDLHQGTVEVKSTVGKGSLFTVRLPPQPLASAQPQSDVAFTSSSGAHRTSSKRSSNRQNILATSGRTSDSQQVRAAPGRPSKGIVVLVENNEEEATLIGEVLRAADYQTIWLTDSSTAAAQIQWLQPSYIILARQLPNLQSTLKTLKATSNARLLLISSDEAQLTELIDDVIKTPIQPAQLLEKLGSGE